MPKFPTGKTRKLAGTILRLLCEAVWTVASMNAVPALAAPDFAGAGIGGRAIVYRVPVEPHRTAFHL